MSTKTMSRILLTALILGGMTPGIYALTTEDYVPYGIIIILLAFALLLWLWKPWRWFKSD